MAVESFAGRGTNLPHEYAAPLAGQESVFEVVVPYLDTAQVRKLVDEHCKNIFEYLEYKASKGSLECEFDPDEVEDMENAYTESVKFFRIILCHLKQFSSDPNAAKYFNLKRKDKLDTVVNELLSWIEDFKCTRRLNPQGEEVFNADTPAQLADVFARVAHAPDSDTRVSHPWPIIDVVQIRFEHELLRSGLKIGDIPGMSDSNQGVVNSSMNYLQKAGLVLLVEGVQRGTANTTLRKNWRQCLRRGKQEHDVRLLLTQIDAIDAKPLQLDRQLIPMSGLSQDDQDKLEAALDDIATWEKKQSSIKRQRKMSKNSDEKEALEKLEEELPAKIHEAEMHFKQVLVDGTVRREGRKAKNALRDVEGDGEAPDLLTYGIANHDYQIHRRGYDLEVGEKPSLDARGMSQLTRRKDTLPLKSSQHF